MDDLAKQVEDGSVELSIRTYVQSDNLTKQVEDGSVELSTRTHVQSDNLTKQVEDGSVELSIRTHVQSDNLTKLSQSILGSMDSRLPLQDELDIREYYLKIINSDKSFDDKKRQLSDELGQKLKKELKEGDYIPDITYGQNSVGRILSFNSSIFLLGKFEENDIVINSPTVSRVHALVYCFEEHMLVLDFWSLNGTLIDNLTTGKIEHSLPSRRIAVKCKITDQVTIRPSNSFDLAILNPKPCIACHDSTRQVKLSCGHSVLCSNCYLRCQKIGPLGDQCIICRKESTKLKKGCFQNTYERFSQAAVFAIGKSDSMDHREPMVSGDPNTKDPNTKDPNTKDPNVKVDEELEDSISFISDEESSSMISYDLIGDPTSDDFHCSLEESDKQVVDLKL